MKKIFIFLFLVVSTMIFSWELRPGTYSLSGTNPNGTFYEGTVVIAPQGSNYRVTWYVGDRQTQAGIGIFHNWENILSVAFADLSQGYWGTISYKINAWDELEGVWASSTSNYQGVETLKWLNYYY